MKKNITLIGLLVLTSQLYTADIEMQRDITDGPYKRKTAVILDNTMLTPSHMQDQECVDILLKRIASLEQEKKIEQFKKLPIQDYTKEELFDSFLPEIKKEAICFCLIDKQRHFIDSRFLEKK